MTAPHTQGSDAQRPTSSGRRTTPPKGRPTPRRQEVPRRAGRGVSQHWRLQWAVVILLAVVAVVALFVVFGDGGGGGDVPIPTHGN